MSETLKYSVGRPNGGALVGNLSVQFLPAATSALIDHTEGVNRRQVPASPSPLCKALLGTFESRLPVFTLTSHGFTVGGERLIGGQVWVPGNLGVSIEELTDGIIVAGRAAGYDVMEWVELMTAPLTAIRACMR